MAFAYPQVRCCEDPRPVGCDEGVCPNIVVSLYVDPGEGTVEFVIIDPITLLPVVVCVDEADSPYELVFCGPFVEDSSYAIDWTVYDACGGGGNIIASGVNSVTFDCDPGQQASTVPVLTECCGEPCQTVSITGTWRWTGPVSNQYGFTPSIVLQAADGSVFWFTQAASRSLITIDGGYFCNDNLSANGPWQVGNPNCSWAASVNSPGIEFPDCLSIETGDTYELKVSWCPDCASELTVTFGVLGDPIQRSMTVLDPCTPLDLPTVCLDAGTCNPSTLTTGSPLITTEDITVTVTNPGLGLYQVTIDDPGPSGLWTDWAATGSPTTYNRFTGAAFGCGVCGAAAEQAWVTWNAHDLGLDLIWPLPLDVTGFSGFVSQAGSGAGLVLSYQIDFLEPPSACGLINAELPILQQYLDDWIAQYGVGTPVVVRNASPTAVECSLSETQYAPGFGFDIERAGVYVQSHCEGSDVPSNLESFAMACGALDPSPVGRFWELSCNA